MPTWMLILLFLAAICAGGIAGFIFAWRFLGSMIDHVIEFMRPKR